MDKSIGSAKIHDEYESNPWVSAKKSHTLVWWKRQTGSQGQTDKKKN